MSKSKLDDIIRWVQIPVPGTSLAREQAKQQIKTLILSKGWYYYDPDELGEDAFKPLTEDEVEEL